MNFQTTRKKNEYFPKLLIKQPLLFKTDIPLKNQLFQGRGLRRMSPSDRQPSKENCLPVPMLPAHHLWAHSPTLKISQFFNIAIFLRFRSDGGPPHGFDCRAEGNSTLAALMEMAPQMFGLSSEGGRTQLGQRPPLRLGATNS